MAYLPGAMHPSGSDKADEDDVGKELELVII
jgi:hypothetical protein